MSPQCFCRAWAIYSFVIFHDVRLSCNMSVFKKASFNRLFSLLITIVISLYKIRFFWRAACGGERGEGETGAPSHCPPDSVPQTPAEGASPPARPLGTPPFLSHGDFVK